MQLTVRYYGPDRESGVQNYDLRVEVTNAVDMSAKVFVWQRKVSSQTDSQADDLGDEFVSVADPVDLEQYPEDSPDLDSDVPYYRTDTVSLRFRSMSELEDVKSRIDVDLTGLLYSLKVNETLLVMEEKTYE